MKDEILKPMKAKMEKALKVLEDEFKGLRTGRASANFLDTVMVNVYGSYVPINQIANIAVSDARTIVVQVWDKSNAKAAEKAIVDANLGVSPVAEGSNIRISMAPPSEERRKEIVKIAAKYAETAKVSIRNVRKAGMDELKKFEKKISEDEFKSVSNEVQKATDEFISKADKIFEAKSKEIMSI